MNPGMYSSATGEWETPLWLYRTLDDSFSFDWDLAANATNSQCGPRYYGPDSVYGEDSLTQHWATMRCWLNPPYGREIGKWVQKAWVESQKGATVVVLLPARTDTRWWHDWVGGKALVVFLKGRLKFGGAENSAPFPSAIAIYLPPLVEPK